MIIDRPIPSDPLADIVALLRPSAALSKLVVAGGAWAVERSADGEPFYAVVLEGRVRLSAEGEEVDLIAGDFVLIPSATRFRIASDPTANAVSTGHVEIAPGVHRVGRMDAELDVRVLVGHCTFGSDDAALLAPLLPRLVHIRGDRRLSALVELVGGEASTDRPGRAAVLARLVELLFIEALRASGSGIETPGLLRGLADPQLAAALRAVHERPAENWTVAALARAAGRSRSAFFDRFRREVGVAPMAYLSGWRMALARERLDRREPIARVAAQVGYGSTETFNAAFARHTGMTPARYRASRSLTDRALAAQSQMVASGNSR